MPTRRVVPFFILTLAITYGLQFPGVLAQRGVLPGDPAAYMPLVGLGLLGPLLAASYLAFREGGKAAVRALYAPLLAWRVPFGWYVLGMVVPGALLTGALLLLNLAGRQGPIEYLPTGAALVAGVVISIVEEVGWRGYALPRLQERFGAVAASIYLGVVWCAWHIPMFMGAGVPLSLLPLMLLFFCGGSLFFTWIYNATGGSLLLAVCTHLGAHLNNSHRALPGDTQPLIAHTVIYAALGLLFFVQSSGRSRAKR